MNKYIVGHTSDNINVYNIYKINFKYPFDRVLVKKGFKTRKETWNEIKKLKKDEKE